MNRLAALITVVSFAFSGCYKAATKPPVPATAPAPTAVECKALPGEYELTVKGALPNHLPQIMKHLCPLDVFLNYKETTKVNIPADAAFLACGTRMVKGGNMLMLLTTTPTTIFGEAVYKIDIGQGVSCAAFYNVVYKKL